MLGPSGARRAAKCSRETFMLNLSTAGYEQKKKRRQATGKSAEEKERRIGQRKRKKKCRP